MVPERMFFCFGICVGLLLGDAGLSEALLRPSAVRLKTTAVVVCADRLKWCSTSAVPLLCLSFLFLNFFFLLLLHVVVFLEVGAVVGVKHLCADFGSGLANHSRSSAANRKWGPNALLRKVFG